MKILRQILDKIRLSWKILREILDKVRLYEDSERNIG